MLNKSSISIYLSICVFLSLSLSLFCLLHIGHNGPELRAVHFRMRSLNESRLKPSSQESRYIQVQYMCNMIHMYLKVPIPTKRLALTASLMFLRQVKETWNNEHSLDRRIRVTRQVLLTFLQCSTHIAPHPV